MKKNLLLLAVSLIMYVLPAVVKAQEPAHYDSTMKPEETEYYKPVPKVVTPGKTPSDPPSDAIVLFDGTNLDKWKSDKTDGPPKWKVANGAVTIVPGTGDMETRQKFEDFQLHIEWREPTPPHGEGQARGNSGIYLQTRYEVQVLDSYKSKTYVNGQAGSIYKQSPPLVNACRPPGEWQTYDIIFKAPRFNDDGSVRDSAQVTVIQNGVLVQNNVKLKGRTLYIGHPYYKKHGPLPLLLQDHHNPVSYRNIWIRPL